MKDAADQQLAAMGITPTSYDHRVYYIPDSTPGCAWAGLSYVGGGVSWMKHANPTLFAHEIGHNLGLHHASLDTNNDGASESEYGDHSAIRGNDLAWRGLLGANRYSLGWLPSSSVFEWDRSCATNAVGQVKIHALTQPPGFGGAYAVMRFPRSSGGNYFVSLRANEGYDRTMNPRWRGQVQVKYMIGTRTYHVKALPAGQQFTDGGIRIKVNAVSGSATVQMCDSSIAQPDSGGNSGGGGGGGNTNGGGGSDSGGGGGSNGGSNTGCADTHGSACQYWAKIGECRARPIRCSCSPTARPAGSATRPRPPQPPSPPPHRRPPARAAPPPRTGSSWACLARRNAKSTRRTRLTPPRSTPPTFASTPPACPAPCFATPSACSNTSTWWPRKLGLALARLARGTRGQPRASNPPDSFSLFFFTPK